ncbi:hypothetical protein GCM10027030_22280 [Luteococcus sediminum]
MPGTQLRGSHAGPVLELALNSAVRELRLMGPGDQVVGSVGISARRSSALVLEDVTIWNTSAGLDLEQCWYAHLVMCSFWHNATAVRIEYCYNVSAHGVRISGLLADGSGNGLGIEMLDRSMLTIHGGAIEQYRTGISLGTSMSVTLFGTYMETRTGGVSGVRVDGIGASVVATGGQVYVMNQAAWIDFTPGSGERQVASGNKFRGGIAGQQVLACRWHPASHDRLRVSVTSDSWHDVVPDEAVRHHSEPLPTASLVKTPAPPPRGCRRPGDQHPATGRHRADVDLHGLWPAMSPAGIHRTRTRCAILRHRPGAPPVVGWAHLGRRARRARRRHGRAPGDGCPR